jgi:26S proteasome regulatory subunit T6
MPVAVPPVPGGIKSYYQAKIEAAEITINRKTQNLRRLEAQRNALNARGASRMPTLLKPKEINSFFH